MDPVTVGYYMLLGGSVWIAIGIIAYVVIVM